jgi:hypothetical protein
MYSTLHLILLGSNQETGEDGIYSGSKITPSFSYVTERGKGMMEGAGGSKTAKSMSEYVHFN